MDTEMLACNDIIGFIVLQYSGKLLWEELFANQAVLPSGYLQFLNVLAHLISDQGSKNIIVTCNFC